MDFYLDPTTHDLDVSGFDIRTTKDGMEAFIQRLKIKLMFFKGEWFLNQNFGIPYFDEIFGQSGDAKDSADNIFKLAIVEMEGVDKLINYSSEFVPTTIAFSLSFSVIYNGEVLTTSLLI